jgi:hypothetical protein
MSRSWGWCWGDVFIGSEEGLISISPLSILPTYAYSHPDYLNGEAMAQKCTPALFAGKRRIAGFQNPVFLLGLAAQKYSALAIR